MVKKRTDPLRKVGIRVSLLAVFLCLLSGASANSLETKNPFLPIGWNKKEEKPPPPPVITTNGSVSREIEFRGVVHLNGTYQFGVFNKSKQKGYWLRENQTKDGISIRGYDKDSRSITLTFNGRSERLSMMEESNAPLPVATSTTPVPNNNANVTPPSLPNGLQNAGQNANQRNKRVIPRRRVILPKK